MEISLILYASTEKGMYQKDFIFQQEIIDWCIYSHTLWKDCSWTAQSDSLRVSLHSLSVGTEPAGSLHFLRCTVDIGMEKKESNDNLKKDIIPEIVCGMQGRSPLLYRIAIYSQAWGTRGPADLPPRLLCIHRVCHGCAHQNFHTVSCPCVTLSMHVCLFNG